MRRLKRRLARWQRYARRYRPGRWPRTYNITRCDIRDPAGFLRADTAVRAERERRQILQEYGQFLGLVDEDYAYDDEGWRPVETVDTGGLL